MINLDYLYNPAAAKEAFDKNYFLNKKLGFQVIEHGMILPHKSVNIPGKWHFGQGGIVDKDGSYIESSSLHHGVGEAYTPPKESILHSSETVIYLAMFYQIWGHDLTDNIRRVWFLKSDTFKSEFKNCPIVYIPYKDGTLTIEKQPSLKRLLEILEVDVDRLRPITQPTQYDKIILPDGSFLSPNNPEKGFTKEYREAIEQVRSFALKNRTPISNKNIYYFHGRSGSCEERIADYFKSKGYEIVRPEKLTLDEQLNLMVNCEHFVSTSGSCAHNALFLRDNSEVILIPRAASKFGYYQEMINQVHPLNITYVDSSLSIFSKGITVGNYFYLVSEQLKRFFGDNFDGYEDEDFKNFLQHEKTCINNGLTINQNAISYYEPVFTDFMTQLKRREDLIAACDMPPDWENFSSTLSYQTHVAYKGWGAWNNEEQISNDLEKKNDIQAIKINFPSHKVYYSVYYNDKEGWTKEVTNGEQAGTTGESKSIMGIKVRLDEEIAKKFNVLYRVHKFDDTWTDWVKNGEELLSRGEKLNAIQIIKLPVNLNRPVLSYQTHISGKGWGKWSDENAISDDIEQHRQIETIKIYSPNHKVYYSVYWNDKEGWSAEVVSPEQAGTTGKFKPIMGIRIRLDEAGAKESNILYRVHKFDGTWTDWAKNGEVIYSHGQKLNAVQIKLETKT